MSESTHKGSARCKLARVNILGQRPALEMLSPPLDHPELLPATCDNGDQVAFQVGLGSPWRLMGSEGKSFKWDALPHNAVPQGLKQEARNLLRRYADEHGIVLKGGLSVRIALRRGEEWISYAGGVSSATHTLETHNVKATPTADQAIAASGYECRLVTSEYTRNTNSCECEVAPQQCVPALSIALITQGSGGAGVPQIRA